MTPTIKPISSISCHYWTLRPLRIFPVAGSWLKYISKALKAAAKAEHQTHDYRQEFLATLLEAAETKGDKDKAKTIRNIKSAEQMSLLWQQVSAAKGTEDRGGITNVKVPTDPQQDPKQCNKEWTTIDDPPEVIAAISTRLRGPIQELHLDFSPPQLHNTV